MMAVEGNLGERRIVRRSEALMRFMVAIVGVVMLEKESRNEVEGWGENLPNASLIQVKSAQMGSNQYLHVVNVP